MRLAGREYIKLANSREYAQACNILWKKRKYKEIEYYSPSWDHKSQMS